MDDKLRNIEDTERAKKKILGLVSAMTCFKILGLVSAIACFIVQARQDDDTAPCLLRFSECYDMLWFN